MKGRVAILGLGTRGIRWAETYLAAGWEVRGFDPDDRAGRNVLESASWQREGTISGAVSGAEWVICCLPERLELMRTVIQRAQASAKDGTVIAVVSETHDLDAVQGCAMRPGHVVRLLDGDAGELALDVNSRNDPDCRNRASETLAMLSAAASVRPEMADMPQHSREAPKAQAALSFK